MAALAIIASGLRPQMVGMGPVLPRMQSELDVPFGIAALAVAIPVLLMGLLSLPSATVGRSLGSVRAIAIGMGLVAAFGMMRVVVADFAQFLLLTAGIGCGTAIAGTLLPVVVKEWFPTRPALGTGAYATALQLGGAAASATAVPIADTFGSWRSPLLLFSVAGSLALVGWVFAARYARRPVLGGASQFGEVRLRVSHDLLGSTTAWLIVGVFTFMSVAYYSLNAWLPAFLLERGWSETASGVLLAAMNAITVPATVSVALIADRLWSRRRYLTVASATLLAATLLIVIAPEQVVIWIIMAGASLGGLFPIALALPVDAGRSSRDVAALAALVFGVGYVIAAAAPVLLGAIRDFAGSFTWGFCVLIAMELLLLAASSLLSPSRLAGAWFEE